MPRRKRLSVKYDISPRIVHLIKTLALMACLLYLTRLVTEAGVDTSVIMTILAILAYAAGYKVPIRITRGE